MRLFIERTVDTRYAIVTVAILLPDWVRDENDVRLYLAESFDRAGVEWAEAVELPTDGERCH